MTNGRAWLLATATVVLGPTLAHADAASDQLLKAIRAQTRAIEQAGRSAEPTPPPALVVRSARVVFTVNIKIRSAIPADATPICRASLAHDNGTEYFVDTSSAVSVRTGGTALCKFQMPIYWTNANTARDVQVSLSVDWPDFLGQTSPSASIVQRSVSPTTVYFPLPEENEAQPVEYLLYF